jgi:hypothetical protein
MAGRRSAPAATSAFSDAFSAASSAVACSQPSVHVCCTPGHSAAARTSASSEAAACTPPRVQSQPTPSPGTSDEPVSVADSQDRLFGHIPPPPL